MEGIEMTLHRTAAAIFVFLLAGAEIGNAVPPDTLPENLRRVRNDIILITFLNTTRTDNVAAVRQELEPKIALLEEWFNANRPLNEIELTQRSWKNLWYDDPDIASFSNIDLGPIGFTQDRRSISQVVRDGFYYNVSQSTIRFFGIEFAIQNYLKGVYEITRPAAAAAPGEARLNVVNLEFVANGIRLGQLPLFVPPSSLVDQVEAGRLGLISIPGPIGVTGELWNLYIDEDLRISAGFDDSEPDVIDLYILSRGR
jgi:hypothetical protein